MEITGGTPRNTTQELERPRRGISRPIYGHMFNDVFDMLVDTRFFIVFGTFIKVDWFGSSTENDATGGPHLFRPTREVFYLQKVRFGGNYKHPKNGPILDPILDTIVIPERMPQLSPSRA